MEAVERDEHNADAWYWLSTVVDEREDREIALENALALNPQHREAQAALSTLRGGAAPPPVEYAPPGSAGFGGLRRPTEAPPHEPLDEAVLTATGEDALFERHHGATAGGDGLVGHLPRPFRRERGLGPGGSGPRSGGDAAPVRAGSPGRGG